MKLIEGLTLMIMAMPVFGDRHANRLLKDLLNHYNLYERPVLNSSDVVVVYFGMGLRQLVGLDEKSQTLDTIIFFKYTWIDVNLDWEPSEYGGIRELSLPISKIWKPDILLYNRLVLSKGTVRRIPTVDPLWKSGYSNQIHRGSAVDPPTTPCLYPTGFCPFSADTPWDRTYAAPAMVYNNGTVHWIPPSYVKSNCHVDVTFFPFDDQHCKFKFGAWTYDLLKLDLRNESDVVDTTFYMPSSDWSLIGTEVIRTVKAYDCCPNTFVDVTFHIYLRRRTLSYGANLIVPTVVTSLMAILVFTLPSESGEKVALDISVFLSLLFCLQMLADRSPPTSESVPLLGLFFLCCTILVALSIVMSVIVLNHHHSDPDTAEMSECEKRFFLLWLPKLVGVSRPPIDTRRFPLPRSERSRIRRPRPLKRKASTKPKSIGSKFLKCEECEEDLLPPCTCGNLIELLQPPLPVSPIVRLLRKESSRSAVDEFDDDFFEDNEDDDEDFFDDDDGANDRKEELPPTYASIFRGQQTRRAPSMREIRNRLRRNVVDAEERSKASPTTAGATIPVTPDEFKNRVLSKMSGRIDPQLRKLNSYIKKGARDDKIKNEWQFAARAIDRLCLYLFFGLIVTIMGAFYNAAPHIVA